MSYRPIFIVEDYTFSIILQGFITGNMIENIVPNRTFQHDGCIVASAYKGSHIFAGPSCGLQCVANA